MAKYSWLQDSRYRLEQVAASRLVNDVTAQLPDLKDAPIEVVYHAAIVEMAAGTFGGKGLPAVADLAARNTQPQTADNMVFVKSRGEVHRWDAGSSMWVTVMRHPLDWENPKTYGAILDGTAHYLTQADLDANAALPAADRWLGTYTTSDTWDYVGIQEAIYHAFAGHASTAGNVVWNSSTNSAYNKGVRIPAGQAIITRRLWTVHTLGGWFAGAGRSATTIDNITTDEIVFQTNGIAYCVFEGITWRNMANPSIPVWQPSHAYLVGDQVFVPHTGFVYDCSVAGTSGTDRTVFGSAPVPSFSTVTDGTAHWTMHAPTGCFDLNWDGSTAGWSGGCQSNTIRDCAFSSEGRICQYGLRVGFGNVPGSGGSSGNAMGSENLIQNCYFIWFKRAGYWQRGQNTFQNTIQGGNFAECRVTGVYAESATVQLISIGFQNGSYQTGYTDNPAIPGDGQYGYDIALTGSVDSYSTAVGCRTESNHFSYCSNGHFLKIGGSYQAAANLGSWRAAFAYSVGDAICEHGRVWVVTTAGTSGGSEPAWPDNPTTLWGSTLTVNDNGVIWTGAKHYAVSSAGTVEDSCFPMGAVTASAAIKNVIVGRADYLAGAAWRTFGEANPLTVDNVEVRNNGANVGGVNSIGATTRHSPTAMGYLQPASGFYRDNYYARRHFVLGDKPLIFSGQSGNQVTSPDVGLWRGDYSQEPRRHLIDVNGILSRRVPVDESVNPFPAVGYLTDTAGKDLRLSGGPATGTGAPGEIQLMVPAQRVDSGTTVTIPVERARVTSAGLKLGGPAITPYRMIGAGTVAYAGGAIASGASASVDVWVQGAQLVGGTAVAGYDQPLAAGILLTATPIANGQVRVTFANLSGGPYTVPAGNLTVTTFASGGVAADTSGITALVTALGGAAVVPFFYDYRFGRTMDGASRVTSLADQSGNAAPALTAPDATREPVYVPGWGLVNDDAKRYLVTAANAAFALNSDWTWVVICARHTRANYGAADARLGTTPGATTTALFGQGTDPGTSAGAVITTGYYDGPGATGNIVIGHQPPSLDYEMTLAFREHHNAGTNGQAWLYDNTPTVVADGVLAAGASDQLSIFGVSTTEIDTYGRAETGSVFCATFLVRALLTAAQKAAIVAWALTEHPQLVRKTGAA